MYKDKLLKLRSDIAKSTHGSTYLVFNDNELKTLLEKMPKTIEELTSIKGFPKNGKRVSTYGKALIQIFNGITSVKSSSNMENTSIGMKKSSFF